MQAEDIIQTKEWQQLLDVERKIVEPLASTEGEYNVLKKMLLIALKDADDVPIINTSIQNELYSYLQKPAKKTRTIFLYAAAASIIAIVFAAFSLLQPEKKNPIAIEPEKKPNKNNVHDTGNKKPLKNISLPEKEPTEIVKQELPKELKLRQTIIKDNIISSRDIPRINTSVSENENLLAFLTEVY